MMNKLVIVLLLLATLPSIMATTMSGGDWSVQVGQGAWSATTQTGGDWSLNNAQGLSNTASSGAWDWRVIPPFIAPTAATVGLSGGGGGGGGGQTKVNFCKRAGGTLVVINGTQMCVTDDGFVITEDQAKGSALQRLGDFASQFPAVALALFAGILLLTNHLLYRPKAKEIKRKIIVDDDEGKSRKKGNFIKD